MGKVTEKKLLYYDRFQRMPKTYNGAPIFHFLCKDVKTSEDITLGSCFFDKEVSKILGEHYYSEITDAEKDYDILWQVTSERISPVADTFEEVQAEYQRMLSSFQTKSKVKSL